MEGPDKNTPEEAMRIRKNAVDLFDKQLVLFYEEKGLDLELSNDPKYVLRKGNRIKVYQPIDDEGGNPGYYYMEFEIGEEDKAKVDVGAIIIDAVGWENI